MCKGVPGKQRASQPSNPPETLIPRTLNDCQHAQTPQMRTILELVKCRAEHGGNFLAVWCKCLRPVFLVQEKELSVERIVRYVAAFAAYRDEDHENECNVFVEEFLKHLLVLADAANKTVRFRACQLIAEVMTRLADDVEVSDELWEDVIESMKQRMQDKIPGVRVNAARALARLVNAGDENDSTVAIYRQSLETDCSADVRKMVVLSIPAIDTTIPQVVERTMDISDLVRKAAYFVVGGKFPIPMLSIMQRVKVLERGLADRVPSVQAECLNMLKTAWLSRDCDGDIIALLRYLDVETNEKVGESVLDELIKQGMIKANEGEGLRQFLLPLTEANTEIGEYEAQLMGAEQALYWRVLCTNLHGEAQARGNEAATTGGAQSALNAAAAADTNETLDAILPPTVANYVDLVTAHLKAGPHHRFAARQLLLLAKVLDFTDSTNRKLAGALVKSLLLAETLDSQQEVPHGIDPEVLVGDGLSLGGDQDWAAAVAELAVKVFSEQGEFEKVLAEAVLKLGQPCRDGGAEVSQWLQCLSVTSLLLERLMSLHQLAGCAIGGQEIADALLLPAVKHIHPEVQKAGLRCLGLFGQLVTKPVSSVVTQLRTSISSGVAVVQNMAIKALFDLVLCHGATSLDRVLGIGPDLGPIIEPRPPGMQVPAEISSESGVTAMCKHLLEVLVSLLDSETIYEETEVETSAEDETARSLVAEGFAKLLLQSKLFKDIQSIEDIILAKLLHLYFNEDLEISPRLQQCLAVFFQNYSVLSAENKKCVARAFIPVMRTEWPGVYGNKGVASAMISAKKRATQISRFMLQLLQNPLLSTAQEQVTGNREDGEGSAPQLSGDSSSPDSGQERLAISIAVEIKRLSAWSTAAAKAYVVALTRILVSLEFRASAQEEIKCMLELLNPVMDAVATDKVLLKELKAMLARLKPLDLSPEQVLSDEQLLILLDNLGLNLPVEEDEENEQFGTPVSKPPSKRPPTPLQKPPGEQTAKRTKKATVIVESPLTVGITRSQRKSKSEALYRLSLSAAKQRIAPSDDLDASSEETSDTNERDTTETDSDDDAFTGVRRPKSTPRIGSVRRVPAKMTRCPTSTSKYALPVANTPLKPLRDSSDASSVQLGEEEQSPVPVHPRPSHRVVIPVIASSKDTTQKRSVQDNTKEVAKPHTRRQVSAMRSEDSALNSQDFATSNVTVEDEANSADPEVLTSSRAIQLQSTDNNPEFQRVPEKSVKKSVTSASKGQSGRRTAWK